MPSTELTIELHSTPVVLGTTTRRDRQLLGDVVIPADTPPGAHQLVVTGLGPDGEPARSRPTSPCSRRTGRSRPVVAAEAVAAPKFTG